MRKVGLSYYSQEIREMKDSTESLLERLTLAGWLLLIVHMGIFALLAPILLFYLCPTLLQIGGRATGYSLAVIAMFTGGLSFLGAKWLFERLGVTILRPTPPSCADRSPPCRS
jgi:hypothetical protein